MGATPLHGPGRGIDLAEPGAFRRLKQKQAESRRKYRRRLEAEGWPPAEIDERLEGQRRRHQAERDDLRAAIAAEAEAQERRESETYARLSLPDAGYRPAPVDPLLRGPARVTPTTARAARRRKALTRYEHAGIDTPEAS